MKIRDLIKFKNILIAGYGIEGKSVERFIKKFHPTARLDIFYFDKYSSFLKTQEKYDLIIRSPSLNPKYIVKPYTTATNLFFNNAKGKIIGVTGTKGKSTTTSLVYHVLKNCGKKAYLCGNIGIPALDLLLEDNDYKNIYVMELSSYQLTDITISPHYSIFLNLYREHINFHGSFNNYMYAKSNIFAFQSKSDVLITSSNLIKKLPYLSNIKSKKIVYSDISLPSNLKTKLIGEHNKNNLRAVYSLVKLFNINDSCFINSVSTFTPLKHRLEYVGTFNKIDFYNDAISTTPESTIEAIRSLKNIGSILLGGLNRGYNFKQLSKEIEKNNIKTIVFFPDSGTDIKKQLNKDYLSKIKYLETRSMEKAVQFCFKYTEPNKICLLSCASPSYSIWKNFEEKGNQFITFVNKYGKKG